MKRAPPLSQFVRPVRIPLARPRVRPLARLPANPPGFYARPPVV
ncbi:MAG TPA: hypothetical protein VGB61_02380 [Pyrinomonadaceae bacterium]